MASKSPEAEAHLRSPAAETFTDEFNERRALWAAQHRPEDPTADFALDRAVAATFRIERCQRAFDDIAAAASERATLAWDQDQAVEAALVAGRLSKDPIYASRKLQTTLTGVELLVEFWVGLASVFQTGSDWDDAERSKALDLLGVAPDLRKGRTLVDAPEGVDSMAFRRSMAIQEIQRLDKFKETAMEPIDEIERMQMMAGDVSLLTKPAKLVARYERDAWRQYRESMKVLEVAKKEAEPAPKPVATPTPAQPRKPAAPPKQNDDAEEVRALEEDRREYRELMAKYLSPESLARAAMVLENDEPEWFGDLERRLGLDEPVAKVAHFAVGVAPGASRATERSQFGGMPAGLAPAGSAIS